MAKICVVFVLLVLFVGEMVAQVGSRLQVWTYDCNGGGSGIFTYASRIKVL
jgi:hypothetical protein